MPVVGAEPELDQCARIWDGFGLPAMVGLILLHGGLCGVIPYSGSFPVQIVFSNKRLLNLQGAVMIDSLLAVMRAFPRLSMRALLMGSVLEAGLTTCGARSLLLGSISRVTERGHDQQTAA